MGIAKGAVLLAWHMPLAQADKAKVDSRQASRDTTRESNGGAKAGAHAGNALRCR